MIRVLIVDDSAFARKVLRETLTESEGFSLAGYARDGLEALEMISQQPIDVVTLDMVMPNLDGLGFLRALRALANPPRVIVVSMADSASALGIEALQEGAFDLVAKPTAQPTQQLYELGDELKQKIRAAASSHVPAVRLPEVVRKPEAREALLQTTRSIFVVGTSTGGPPALSRLLSDLPANFPVPIAMVLHIPQGYTAPLAERLDQLSKLKVVEATEGLVLEPGMAVLAQAGRHLRLVKHGQVFHAHLSDEPHDSPHRPAVDVLFESVLSEGPRVLAAILTGMGDDGLNGCRALRKAGATVLSESEKSCVVFGMPRAVQDEKLSEDEAPISRMAKLVTRYL